MQTSGRVDSEKLADAILANLERVFGLSVYSVLIARITQDYTGGNVDARMAIIKRPDLFELGFVSLIGPLGENFLADLCSKIKKEFGLDDSAVYVKAGDLARYVATATGRT